MELGPSPLVTILSDLYHQALTLIKSVTDEFLDSRYLCLGRGRMHSALGDTAAQKEQYASSGPPQLAAKQVW